MMLFYSIDRHDFSVMIYFMMHTHGTDTFQIKYNKKCKTKKRFVDHSIVDDNRNSGISSTDDGLQVHSAMLHQHIYAPDDIPNNILLQVYILLNAGNSPLPSCDLAILRSFRYWMFVVRAAYRLFCAIRIDEIDSRQ